MDNLLTILQGDALTMLRTLPDESVQCCVTSPPYWGLRDYGTATWNGGSLDCDHSTPRSRGDDIKTGDKQGTSAGSRPNTQRECQCGAIRVDSQLGLENTPEAYVDAIVGVFREVGRVLRKDGTLWLNLGDSYAGGGNYRGIHSEETLSAKQRSNGGARGVSQALGAAGKQFGCKPKDLVGIPWMVAFALRADGWYLRMDIIWHKPNPMPESVTDRPTKSHEYIFLLSKSASYYYDADAIAEPAIHAGEIKTQGEKTLSRGQSNGSGRPRSGNANKDFVVVKDTRNKRSVWSVISSPYPDAHFATYPPELITSCILAGSRIGDTILDPFGGSGTTGKVAIELGRKAILIELNPEYVELIKDRCRTAVGLPWVVQATSTTNGNNGNSIKQDSQLALGEPK